MHGWAHSSPVVCARPTSHTPITSAAITVQHRWPDAIIELQDRSAASASQGSRKAKVKWSRSIPPLQRCDGRVRRAVHTCMTEFMHARLPWPRTVRTPQPALTMRGEKRDRGRPRVQRAGACLLDGGREGGHASWAQQDHNNAARTTRRLGLSLPTPNGQSKSRVISAKRFDAGIRE
jgi:hypothetical protein